MNDTTAEKRKTYSLAPDRSRDLARAALDMGEELDRTVARQDILDSLVGLLAEPAIYKKVLKAIRS